MQPGNHWRLTGDSRGFNSLSAALFACNRARCIPGKLGDAKKLDVAQVCQGDELHLCLAVADFRSLSGGEVTSITTDAHAQRRRRMESSRQHRARLGRIASSRQRPAASASGRQRIPFRSRLHARDFRLLPPGHGPAAPHALPSVRRWSRAPMPQARLCIAGHARCAMCCTCTLIMSPVLELRERRADRI